MPSLINAADDPQESPPPDNRTASLLNRIQSNPVGTEYAGPAVSMQRGPFDEIVGQGAKGEPMTATQADAFRQWLAKGTEAGMATVLGITGEGAGRAPRATVADIGGGQRGMMAVPSLRSMTPAEAAEAASSEPHIIPKAGGGFVGAPDWVQTPENIQQMRANLDDAIDRGSAGRDWYGSARRWLEGITGTKFDPATGAPVYGNPAEGRTAAEGLASMSLQADRGGVGVEAPEPSRSIAQGAGA